MNRMRTLAKLVVVVVVTLCVCQDWSWLFEFLGIGPHGPKPWLT